MQEETSRFALVSGGIQEALCRVIEADQEEQGEDHRHRQEAEAHQRAEELLGKGETGTLQRGRKFRLN